MLTVDVIESKLYTLSYKNNYILVAIFLIVCDFCFL